MAAQFSTLTNPDDPRTLVVVFLRGAADGLTLVAPVEDDNYHRFRPRLAVKKREAIRLDGFFGLHPRLLPLEAAWKDGDLAIVHGVGGESDTRSHFEAQDLMEHGGVAAGGWLGRFLRSRGPAMSPLSAVAIGSSLPESLSGAPSATALHSLKEFAVGRIDKAFPEQLRRLYERAPGPLRAMAQNTFDAVRRMQSISASATPENGAVYTEDDNFAQGLRQIAQLIKADVGLSAASIDLPGWDSHFTQVTVIEPLMQKLASGLAAFRADLGKRMATTTVVVMTEFGRRVAENSAFGTDHGRGSAMLVLGGGVRGGRVWGGPMVNGPGGWPGLRPEMLEGPGDLPVWNNYRDVLAPVLARHGADEAALREVFPSYSVRPGALYS